MCGNEYGAAERFYRMAELLGCESEHGELAELYGDLLESLDPADLSDLRTGRLRLITQPVKSQSE